MALTKVHNRMIEAAPINIKDLGAVGDGIADDTAAIQAAFNSDIHGIYIPSGTYKITSQLTLNKQKRIFGDGASSIINTDGITSDIYAIKVQPSTTGYTFIEANANELISGDSSYTFSSAAHGLAVNDVVCFANPTNGSYNDVRTYYKAGEFLTVKSVSGATVEFITGSYDGYAVSAANIYKMDFLDGVVVENFSIEGTPTNYAEFVLDFEYCRNVRARNVTINNAGNYMGIGFSRCFQCSVTDSKFVITEFGNLANNAYPMLVSNCQSIKFNNCFGSSPWHALAVGGGSAIPVIVCRDIKVIGCTLETKASNFAGDFHGNTEHSGYYNCTLKGSGITLGAVYNEFIGNDLHSTYIQDPGTGYEGVGLGFYGSEALSLGFTISNNVCEFEGWYPYNDFGQFVELLNRGATQYYTSGLTITDNQVLFLATTTSTTRNGVIRIYNTTAASLENTTVNISGNSFWNKLTTVQEKNYILVDTFTDADTDQIHSVNISNNNLKGVNLEINNAKNLVIANNNISGGYNGIRAHYSGNVNITGNIVEDCKGYAGIVYGVRDTMNVSNNIFKNNNTTSSSGSGVARADLYIDTQGLGTDAMMLAGNVFSSTANANYSLTIADSVNMVESNNIYAGSPAVQSVVWVNGGPGSFIQSLSNIFERDYWLSGNAATNIATITFDNPNQGSVLLRMECVYAGQYQYTGTFEARIHGYNGATAVVDNQSYSSSSDPVAGGVLSFSISTDAVTITLQNATATELSRHRITILQAARSADIENLNIKWLI